MNKQIQKIVEDFSFNSMQNAVDNAGLFAENVLGLVDLGLPSGTLWCECNLGAENEYDCGDYYAWGELTTKDVFISDNYTCKDDALQLSPKHDIATQKLGNNYSIPTKDQCDELLKYTNNKRVENYKGTGVNGWWFVSKTNGNALFIPAAGSRYGSNLYNIDSNGYVWTSTRVLNLSDCAWCLYFDSDVAYVNYDGRYQGNPIRPVFKK